MAAWRSTGRLPGEAGARPASAAAETLRTAPRR
jgi:hypothetical protein